MARRWAFNPFSGLLEPTETPTSIEFAEKIADIFDCSASVSVGDVVRPSESTENTVIKLTSNVYPNLVMGVVISKPTISTCEVLISGKLSGLSGLTFGKPVFVSGTGTVTTVVPTTGHRQIIGQAIKSDTIFLLPSMDKVVLS